jgi:hypothetical protein
MTIIENQADRIIADRLDVPDSHILFSHYEDFLARTMPFDFRAGALNAKIFCRQRVRFT